MGLVNIKLNQHFDLKLVISSSQINENAHYVCIDGELWNINGHIHKQNALKD